MMSKRPKKRGQSARLIFLAMIALAIAGCATAPPAVVSTAQRQTETLRALNFQPLGNDWIFAVPEPISFDVGESAVKPQYKQSIAKLASELREVHIDKLRLVGHTDSTGPLKLNVELSRARAESVAAEFIAHGYMDSNIERNGVGPEHPAASNDNPAGRAMNRRVEIIIPANALAPGENRRGVAGH